MSQTKRFKNEQDADKFARANNGIYERTDWKELDKEDQDKPWLVSYGPGIVRPPEPSIISPEQAENATLRARLAEMESKVEKLTAKTVVDKK